MKVNTNRDNISLEQALAYIQFINKEQPFEKEDIVIPTKDIDQSNGNKQKVVTIQQKKKGKLQEQSDQDLTKKINKNRAIKRIIQSAFQILQNFSNYEEDNGAESNDKSSEIQFNIYLKQYNRVLQMIYKRQVQRLSIQAQKAQERQQILQNIYQYTVVQDFREILPTATVKDKISKANLQMMIDKLAKSLVVLKPNELKIYDSVQPTSSFKSIRLHQIENVDYHTQPYIFIVLTIQKDKERFNIYLQFESQKNQEKWDRALYCCYIGRKMHTKQKFFVIEYPEEDVKKKQKQQTKKQAAFNYQITDKRTPMERIYNQKRSIAPSEHSRQLQPRQNSDNMSHSMTRGIKKQQSNLSREEHELLLRQQKSQMAMAGTKSYKFTNVNQSDTNRFLDIEKKDPSHGTDLINRNRTDYINIKKEDTPVPVRTPNQKDFSERKNNADFGIQIEDQTSFMNDPKELKQEQRKGVVLPDDIKQVHNLERKNVKGLILQKEKFFFNKAKIVYLKESSAAVKQQKQRKMKQQQFQYKDIDITSEYEAMKERELQYWDFDSKSGEQTECKIIKLPNIKNFNLNEQKQSLLIIHEKQITFIGSLENLREIYEWIDRILKIYATKLAPQ